MRLPRLRPNAKLLIALAVLMVLLVVWLDRAPLRGSEKFLVASQKYAEYAGYYERNLAGGSTCYGERWDAYSRAISADVAKHAGDEPYRKAQATYYRGLARQFQRGTREHWLPLPAAPETGSELARQAITLQKQARVDARAAEQRSSEAKGRWVEAMPPGVKRPWEADAQYRNGPFAADVAPLRRALEAAVLDKNERILALFTWYGSGAGPWSGFPSYEDIAETMLLDYATADLLAATAGKTLTTTQTEGVARLFAGWTFHQLRPDDLRVVPAELKARLLKHSLASASEDKRGRARSAFGAE